MNQLRERTDGLRAQRTPFVLATVVRAERPTSAKAGDRALMLPDGTIEGFVGGACAEPTVRLHGLRLLESGESTLLRIQPTADPGQSTVEGLTVADNPCLSGGTLEIFLEAVLPPTLVHVFGTAPIARALAEVGAAVGYEVQLSHDPREPVPPDATAVVVASHGRDEVAVLGAALRAGVPYVALVASPRRGAAVVAELGDLADLPAGAAQRLHTPAGLDIGARTPEEVALSILAEFVAQRVRPRTAAPATVDAVAPVTQAVDPVCAMTVAAVPTSLRLEHAGKMWYFCGPGCRQAFADDPARYGA